MADQNLTLKIKVGVDGQPQVELLNTSLAKVQNTTKTMGSSFLSLGTALKGFAAAFAVREVFAFSNSVIEMGDQLQKASQKTGFAVSELSKLKTTAELADVGFESLQTALKKLNVNLVDAASGSKPLQEAFKSVGISAKDLRNINASEALSKVAEAFANTKDGAEKAAIAVKLFGRNGVELIPFLNTGKEGIREFGLELSDDFAKSAEKFNDSLKLLKNSFSQLGINIIGPILEPVRSLFSYIALEVDLVSTRMQQSFVYLSGFISALTGKFSDIPAAKARVNAELLKLDDDFNKRSAIAAKQAYAAGLPKAVSLGRGSLVVGKDESSQKARKAEQDALSDFIAKQKETISLLELEGQKINLTDLEYKKLVETKKSNAETERDSSKYTKENLATFKRRSEAFLQERLRLMELNDQQKKTFGYGAKEAFDEYVSRANNTAQLVKSAFEGVFTRLEDSLVNFVKTGKLNFADLANFIIDEIIRIQIKQAIIGPLVGAISGLFSSAATGSTSTAGEGQSFATTSANGNVMTKDGPLALNYYSKGGIARSPQLSIFGEGSTPEAYVPLPDGRSIPVSFKGNSKGASSGDSNVTVNVNVESGKENNISDSKKAEQLGTVISNAVKREIVLQKRQGGLLA